MARRLRRSLWSIPIALLALASLAAQATLGFLPSAPWQQPQSPRAPKSVEEFRRRALVESTARSLASIAGLAISVGAPGVAEAVQLALPSEADCPDCRIGGGGGVKPALALEAEQRVLELVAKHPVVIFSKTWCPYCSKAKAALTAQNVQYETVELDNLPPGEALGLQQALGRMTGASTVPRVFVYGSCIGGGDDTVALQKSGELKRLLEERVLPRNEKLKLLADGSAAI